MFNNTICIVQPSQIRALRLFLLLPYCKENLQFLKYFHFQYSHLKDSEHFQLYKNFVGNKHCYAKHCIDVGKISTLFRIRLKADTQLRRKDSTEFLLKLLLGKTERFFK